MTPSFHCVLCDNQGTVRFICNKCIWAYFEEHDWSNIPQHAEQDETECCICDNPKVYTLCVLMCDTCISPFVNLTRSDE